MSNETKKAKALRIKFDNGDLFDVPALDIAKNRASHYAQMDLDRGEVEDYDTAFQTEIDYAMGDPSELKDWMENNMDWSEIEPIAKKVSNAPAPKYSEMFADAEIRVMLEES